MSLVEEVLGNGRCSGVAKDNNELGLGMHAANRQVLIRRMCVPKAFRSGCSLQEFPEVSSSTLRVHDFRPGHCAVPNVTCAHGVIGSIVLGRAQDLDDELFGQVSADLLMGANADVIFIGIPGVG